MPSQLNQDNLVENGSVKPTMEQKETPARNIKGMQETDTMDVDHVTDLDSSESKSEEANTKDNQKKPETPRKEKSALDAPTTPTRHTKDSFTPR